MVMDLGDDPGLDAGVEAGGVDDAGGLREIGVDFSGIGARIRGGSSSGRSSKSLGDEPTSEKMGVGVGGCEVEASAKRCLFVEFRGDSD